MPKINVHVKTFSSEDPVHVAANILKDQKWVCKKAGEANATLILEFKQAVVISEVHIGNANSALIEVLVKRSCNDNYESLLTNTVFMSTSDTRDKKNVNQVKMFTHENLCSPVCKEKWDEVKIICRQPFDKTVQYGLSFIRFSTPSNPLNTIDLGRFSLRAPSPEVISSKKLGLTTAAPYFNEWKAAKLLTDSPNAPKVGFKRTLNEAHSEILEKRKKFNNESNKQLIVPIKASTSDQTNATSKNAKELIIATSKQSNIIKKQTSTSKETTVEASKQTNTPSKNLLSKETSKQTNTPSNNKLSKETLKQTNTPFKNKPSKEIAVETNKKLKASSSKESDVASMNAKINRKKQFDKLLEGVRLVISGIQNPTRHEIREKAIAMGAQYSNDWTNSCTHLICAFKNTPKYNQVKGKGKIVIAQWILDCHSQRKRLPWRTFALDHKEKKEPISDEEICEESDESLNKTTPRFKAVPTGSQSNNTNIDDKNNLSGSDTEDEIERIQNLPKQPPKNLQKNKKTNLSGSDTEDKLDSSDKSPKQPKKKPVEKDQPNLISAIIDRNSMEMKEIALNELQTKLPNFLSKLQFFFAHLTFYLDLNLSTHGKCVKQYIAAYEGKISKKLSEVDIVIINQSGYTDFSNQFEKAMLIKKYVFLTPKWIYDCHKYKELLTYEDYVIKE